MSEPTSTAALTDLVNQVIAGDPDVFLVSVRVKPTHNIKVFLDADSGLSIEKCIRINRAMYKLLEEKAWYPEGEFSLEVSSSGVDEPLQLERQYRKNTGRQLEVVLHDGTVLKGKLMEAGDTGIRIEYTEGKNKKAVTHNRELAYTDIKTATVQVSF
jgi:ribosome maturation factor RimP